MQRIIATTLMLLVAVSVSSCSQISNAKNSGASQQYIPQIALLLPFSGSEQKETAEYLQMVKLGLSDNAQSKIHITAYDATTPTLLKESLGQIVENGTDIVIGPLYPAPSKLSAQELENKGVIVISLANDPTLADKEFFVFGHAPLRQLECITNYLLQAGHKNYITLLPLDRQSKILNQTLENIITEQGGSLNKSEFYANNSEQIERAVKIVAEQVNALNESDDSLTKPVILLADDQLTLGRILRRMKDRNLDEKAIIAGDNHLDIHLPYKISTMFTTSWHSLKVPIKKRAVSLGINYFSPEHAIAYDAGSVVASSIGTAYSKQQFLSAMRDSPQGFLGVSGKITFIDSIAQRQYDVVYRRHGRIELLSPAKLAPAD